MFIDTRRVEPGSVVETTVCIIGGFDPDDTRDLCRGEDIGLPTAADPPSGQKLARASVSQAVAITPAITDMR